MRMKKFFGFVTACLIACSLYVPPASAALAQGWLQSDVQDAVTFRWPGPPTIYTVGIYDHNTQPTSLNASNTLTLLSIKDLYQQFRIYNVGASTYATELSASRNPIGTPLALTGQEFGFYAFNTVTATYLPDYTIMGSGDNWVLSWEADGGPVILASDVSPAAPIPAAFLLLGSGLVGLVGFKRKNKN